MHILYACIAMIGFGLSSGIAKHLSGSVGSAQTVLWSRLIALPFLILILVVFAREPIAISSLLLIFAVGVFGYLPLYCFYRSLNYGPVGVLGPLGSTSTVIAIILSVVFLGELVSIGSIIGIFAIFVGIFLVSVDFKVMRMGITPKALLYITGAILGRGLMYFFFKVSIDASSPMWTICLVEAGVLLGSIVHEYTTHEKFPIFTKDKNIRKGLLAMVVVANIAGIAYNYGLQLGPVPTVIAIFAGAPLVTALYGVIVYQEQLVARQWIGIGVLVLGLVLVSGVIALEAF